MISRRTAFAALAIVIGLTAGLLVTEGVLRMLKDSPIEIPALDIVVEPGGKTQLPDPVLGFRPIPGRYTVTFDHRDPWELTNLSDTTRITSPLGSAEDRRGRGIWVFGCSFVQGWGLNDADTFAWKLQERFPDYPVTNFGVGGYGTLQSLLQLQQALRERPSPAVIILAYAWFHDDRNTFTNGWRDANISYRRFGTTAQPYARFDDNGQLRYYHSEESVPLLWLRSRSAMFNLALESYGRAQDAGLRSHEVTELLLDRFAEESRQSGAHFVLAGIAPSPLTEATLRRFEAGGTHTVDISVDDRDPANVIPYDGHPSAIANDHFAETLATALQTRAIVVSRQP
ncbi:MAG: SGNH/GDSL hydrolase family protein [Acidobacteria bacterium]|nr:SGNH/GDSL hydrolase family protein [Acidobacteriota bacterium]